MKKFNVLFFGTPQIAVPYLEWLINYTSVVGVVCRPDEPVGRGYKITPPPTKILAQEKGIPVFQPQGPWSDDTMNAFKNLNADLGVVVAYGRILPKSIFSLPRFGCLNIHFSLLPKYRGAAPMQWSLINGEKKSGVTSFWLEEGLDSGPMASQLELSLQPREDILSLKEKMISLGLTSLEQVLDDLGRDRVVKRDQTGEPSLAPLLKKEMGRIDWSQSATSIVNLVRGVREWPGAYTTIVPSSSPSKKIKVTEADVETPEKVNDKFGFVVEADKNGILISSAKGYVRLMTVQPEGKKPMMAYDFWMGARLRIGDHCE